MEGLLDVGYWASEENSILKTEAPDTPREGPGLKTALQGVNSCGLHMLQIVSSWMFDYTNEYVLYFYLQTYVY